MRIWNLEKYSENIAFIDEYDNIVTYADLQMCEKEISQICSRCLVAILCHNNIGAAVGYISFINNGIVPMMLNAHMDSKLLHNLFNTYKPSYVWCPTDEIEQFSYLNNKEVKYQAYKYSLVRMDYDSEYKLNNELALLLTTSGSTGSPKFVRQSYKNIKANAEAIIGYLEIDDKERPITTLPMNYTYGLSIVNSHIMAGATILITEKSILQKEFWNFFNSQSATSFGGVPYTYEMLDKLRFYKMELPSLKTITQAGGKITPELHSKIALYAKRNNIKFVVMYGQCEATARMGYLPPENAIEKCGSMGVAIPGGSFSIVDSDGKEINEVDVAGELIYKGPNVTLGYALQASDLEKDDEWGGILRTGDVAKRDKDGFYYIVGRLKRFLKIYGNRVNLDEVEQLIKSKFEGIDVACAGVDDHMYIFMSNNEIETVVKEYVVNQTRLNSSAFKTIIVESIPKNEAGKILYKELERYY